MPFHKGQHFSPETRKKFSEARKQEWASGERNTSHLNTPEVNAKKKLNNAKYWLDKKRPDIGVKISIALKGKPSPLIGRKFPERSGENNVFNRPEVRAKQLQNVKRGENHPNWKGGVTSVYRTIRKSIEYRQWRKAVFERDNYTCQFCKIRGGLLLHPDHIKPFALYPELRFDINNGRTLCIDCHKKTDTYGYKTVKLALKEVIR